MKLKVALCAAVLALGVVAGVIVQQGDPGLTEGNEAARRVAAMEPGDTREELVEQLLVMNPGTTREEMLASAEQAAVDSGMSVEVVLEQFFQESKASIEDARGS